MARILVVEDNPQNMRLAAVVLEQAGHEVFQAVDAATGIDLARATRPDLILMDLQLPDMDGLAATRVLKADPVTQRTPICALTACAMKGDEERIREAGCDGYITKPIRYREFLNAVTAVLG